MHWRSKVLQLVFHDGVGHDDRDVHDDVLGVSMSVNGIYCLGSSSSHIGYDDVQGSCFGYDDVQGSCFGFAFLHSDYSHHGAGETYQCNNVRLYLHDDHGDHDDQAYHRRGVRVSICDGRSHDSRNHHDDRLYHGTNHDEVHDEARDKAHSVVQNVAHDKAHSEAHGEAQYESFRLPSNVDKSVQDLHDSGLFQPFCDGDPPLFYPRDEILQALDDDNLPLFFPCDSLFQPLYDNNLPLFSLYDGLLLQDLLDDIFLLLSPQIRSHHTYNDGGQTDDQIDLHSSCATLSFLLRHSDQ